MKIYDTIVSPITTEKSTMFSDKGKYVFLIAKDATKIDVKHAIKQLYDADVEKVNITQIQPKTRLNRGKFSYDKRNAAKKAVVTIKDGKAIDVTKFKESKKKK
ncbi:50S ribosomal protein L23 [Patescibacteria group bacterium]|nr:50S ribosomal protein L23 [Patescibacteria group bacterium]